MVRVGIRVTGDSFLRMIRGRCILRKVTCAWSGLVGRWSVTWICGYVGWGGLCFYGTWWGEYNINSAQNPNVSFWEIIKKLWVFQFNFLFIALTGLWEACGDIFVMKIGGPICRRLGCLLAVQNWCCVLWYCVTGLYSVFFLGL